MLLHKPFSLPALLCVTSLCAAPFLCTAQEAHINVDAAKVMNKIPLKMYGTCMEDVNHEIYGGLYDQRIFGESFEEPRPSLGYTGWKVLGGEWNSDNNVLSIESSEGDKMVKDEPVALSTGDIEVKLKFTKADGSAGLIVGVSNERKGADSFWGYEISLDPRQGTVLFGKHRNNWRALKEEKASFNLSGWNTLKVHLDGANLQIYLNSQSQPIIDYTDANPLPAGKVGIRAYNANVSFKDIIINGNSSQFDVIPTLDVSNMWSPINTAKTGVFEIDATTAVNGAHSQIFEHTGGAGKVGVANMSLNHWGISVKKAQPFVGHLYLKGAQAKVPVTAALQSEDGSRTYASQTINGISSDWKKFTISLTPNATDPKARFAVYTSQKGKFWVDMAVLMLPKKDQYKGYPFRPDIASTMKNEGLNFIRYGGTMVNAPEYRWKKMIGDRDKRPQYKGHWYPYSTNGFGIEEFVQFAEAAGLEPAFAINIEETPEDVADMVEYLKGPATSKWGKMRAQMGHPAPYKLHYIEIGNEEILFNIKDKSQYEHYIERFNLLHDAIHKVDPGIKLINAVWWRPESPFSEMVFKALDGKADYWDLHTGGDHPRDGLMLDKDLTVMRNLFLKWNPNTTMRITIFEENGGTHGLSRALGHASNLNAVRRHGDFVLTSCAANALQPLRQNDNGWDQGQIFFTPSQAWGMPPFYATQMAAANHEPLRVESEADAGLDVTATRSEDGKTLILHVVNGSANMVSTTLNIKGFDKRKPTVKVSSLAGTLDAVNTPQQPAKTSTKLSTIKLADNNMNYSFPATSYTILRFER